MILWSFFRINFHVTFFRSKRFGHYSNETLNRLSEVCAEMTIDSGRMLKIRPQYVYLITKGEVWLISILDNYNKELKILHVHSTWYFNQYKSLIRYLKLVWCRCSANIFWSKPNQFDSIQVLVFLHWSTGTD